MSGPNTSNPTLMQAPLAGVPAESGAYRAYNRYRSVNSP
jgi:hypothetical protein